MLDRVQLKYEAKAITKNARVSAYVFTLIYLAIGLALDGIDYLVSGGPQVVMSDYMMEYMPEAAVYLQGTEPILHLPAIAVNFVSIVVSLVAVVLSAGYLLYTINVRKGIVTPYVTMFDGFLFVGKVILLHIIMTIFIFLWAMLCFIPGIIASYRYRFATRLAGSALASASTATSSPSASPGSSSTPSTKKGISEEWQNTCCGCMPGFTSLGD